MASTSPSATWAAPFQRAQLPSANRPCVMVEECLAADQLRPPSQRATLGLTAADLPPCHQSCAVGGSAASQASPATLQVPHQWPITSSVAVILGFSTTWARKNEQR